MPRRLDLVGQTFQRLHVIEFAGMTFNHKSLWKCECICGGIKICIGESLKNGHTGSCGCLRQEASRKMIVKLNTTHGMSSTKFYQVWYGMKTRCYNKNNKDYKNYGGRGIIMCDRWFGSIENFIEDMYPSYLKHIKKFGKKGTSLDRIDVMGNYEPSNCKWSTTQEQNRNTRVASSTTNYEEHMRWRTILMSCINHILFENQKTSKYIHYFGCTVEELKQHFESQFTGGMTWKNHGKSAKNKKVWQIDHIIPIYKFDLTKEQDRLDCWNYRNLRPMWWRENVMKSKIKR